MDVDELLRARESRVLAWTMMARMCLISVGIFLSVLHLTRLIPPGIAAETDADALGVLLVFSVFLAAYFFGWAQARNQRRLFEVGLGAVLLDLLTIVYLPILWMKVIGGEGGSPAFLMKNELALIVLVLMVVNSLALRPLHILSFTAGSIVIHLAIAVYVSADPSVSFTTGFLDHFETPAVNAGIFILRLILLALVGAMLALAARATRRTIRESVELEHANYRIREQQAELLFESKMTALNDLVAGVAHEINTPLGAAKSGIDTMAKGIQKISEQETAHRRIVDVLSDNAGVARTALDRISGLVKALKGFSTLDEAEVQKTDLASGLDDVLSLIQADLIRDIRVEKAYAELPRLVCRPRELNQVWMTLIVNGLEAMEGEGTLRLSAVVSGGAIVVGIEDTGCGMRADQLDNLFEIGFAESRGRVSMGLGLPTARKIVDRHGGTIQVRSELGRGTTFTIELPLTREAATAQGGERPLHQ